MELKKHQEECIENIEDNFLENKKGLIKMFCGSGKSLRPTPRAITEKRRSLTTKYWNDLGMSPMCAAY